MIKRKFIKSGQIVAQMSRQSILRFTFNGNAKVLYKFWGSNTHVWLMDTDPLYRNISKLTGKYVIWIQLTIKTYVDKDMGESISDTNHYSFDWKLIEDPSLTSSARGMAFAAAFMGFRVKNNLCFS